MEGAYLHAATQRITVIASVTPVLCHLSPSSSLYLNTNTPKTEERIVLLAAALQPLKCGGVCVCVCVCVLCMLAYLHTISTIN